MAEGSAKVVILGDIPATGHFPDAGTLRGPALTSPDDVAPDFLDLVARNLPASSAGILVVYPRWQADPAKRLIRLTRGMLDTDQVASVGLDLPPLACSVVADLLSLAAPHLQTGHLAGLAARLRDSILSGARVATVAKLEHIDTKLTQHMASYSPGSGFLAWAAPEGRIDRISRRRPLTPPDFRPVEPVQVLLAPYGADFPEFEKELGASLRPDSVKKVAAQPLGATFWGTRKHVEFVAFSAHPQVLSDIVRSTRYWMCRWCRQPTALDVCAICGMFQEARAGVSGRVPEVVGAVAGGSAGGSFDAPSRSAPADHGPAFPAPPVFLTAQAAPQTTSPQGDAEMSPQSDAGTAETSAETSPKDESAPSPEPGAGAHTVQSTHQNIARPGTDRGRDDDRAVPFGKGALGDEPAASGGRAPEQETTTQARPAGTAAPAQQDQHDQQEQQSP